MSHHHWMHGMHAAHRESHRRNHKAAGVIYIIVGFFLAPMLIGIPIMLYGLCKLVK